MEHKLGVNDAPRPTTSRPGTRAKTSRGGRRGKAAAAAAAADDEEQRPKTKGGKNGGFRVVSEVSSYVIHHVYTQLKAVP